MTKQDYYNLTHDENGNAFLWIIGQEKDNGKGEKPDLTVWGKGYSVDRLYSFAEYLKGTTCFPSFLLIEVKTGNVCRLIDYMESKGRA